MASETSTCKRRKGISPWKPNQHGAWAMLITPAVVGAIACIILAVRSGMNPTVTLVQLVFILIAWFFGYFTFFAFGMVAKARTSERRKQYITPVFVYGAVSLAALVPILLFQPLLIYWGIVFAPLIAIAVVETLRGRPRSTLSGVSTTIASALLVSVLAHLGAAAGFGEPWEIWAGTIVLALFFSGSVTYVKSMIRERKNPRYLRGSIVYHAVALVVTIGVVSVTSPGWLARVLLVAGMAWALVRSWYYPRQQQDGRKFTPKQVGLKENPPLLLVAFGALFACL